MQLLPAFTVAKLPDGAPQVLVSKLPLMKPAAVAGLAAIAASETAATAKRRRFIPCYPLRVAYSTDRVTALDETETYQKLMKMVLVFQNGMRQHLLRSLI